MKFHPVHNKRISDNPVLNKLLFNGYHIQGKWDAVGSVDHFHDHYPTLESYYEAFSYVRDRHVLSPREIYLSKFDPSCGEYDLVITDNDGHLLWDDTVEEKYQASLIPDK